MEDTVRATEEMENIADECNDQGVATCRGGEEVVNE